MKLSSDIAIRRSSRSAGVDFNGLNSCTVLGSASTSHRSKKKKRGSSDFCRGISRTVPRREDSPSSSSSSSLPTKTRRSAIITTSNCATFPVFGSSLCLCLLLACCSALAVEATTVESTLPGTNSCLAIDDKVIKIGYLTAVSGKTNPKRQGLVISGAISYAVEKINSNNSLLRGRKLELIYNDTHGETLTSTRAMLDQWRRGVQVWFGPEDSCVAEATIASSLNLPLITYKCADSKVSRTDFFSTFARTFPSDIQVVRSVVALLDYYNWDKFSVIHENTDQYRTVAASLQQQALVHPNKFKVNSKRTFENFYSCCEERKSCCMNPFLDIVEETYKGTRIYVFIGRESDLIKMMLVLRMRGLLDHGEYMVLYIDLEPYMYDQSFKYFYGASMTTSDVMAAREAARSLLVIVPSPPAHQNYTFFEDKVREYNAKAPFNFVNPFERLDKKKHITLYASYLYDAVMQYAEAVSETLKAGESVSDGRAIIQRFIDKKRYKSITGAIMKIDENGEVEGPYTVLSLQPSKPDVRFRGIAKPIPNTMLPVGKFEYDESRNETKFMITGPVDWVGKRPPLMEPPCGYDGSACRAPVDGRREILSGVIAGLFVTASLLAAVTYRNWKYEQEISGLLWNIHKKDIQFYSGGMQMAQSFRSLASNMSGDFIGQKYTMTATYRCSEVAVKELRFSKRLDVVRETKKEMKLMKEIQQDNINPFIGACIEPNNISIFTEYCAKGSLQDILEKDDLKLDLMFIASLVFDLIHAMIFLQESDLRMHGNLKSSNCLVTSRWVLRVTDFGLHQLRATCDLGLPSGGSEASSSVTYDNCKSLVWKAPELLRNPNILGTPKGDVYAFAIIFHEILARQGPFGLNDLDCELSAKEIIYQIKEPQDETEPFRPPMASLQYQDYILTTMTDSWSELPEQRPDFRAIKQRLKKMRHGMKPNIMDNMIAMMEKYANNLEELVDERTAQLMEEKKKTVALLHRMLPTVVASQLVRGEHVAPETFDAVTIFFSDIVGFTTLSAESTPIEVVDLLNDLYTLFDSIIESYDVYKVETIGDSYMVASGLPIRNGDQHAAEIASMALSLIDSVTKFRVRHRPDYRLQMRIGIHTGPVCAGVVGSKMPRYCLFGDTVNTASRMETTSLPLKVHCSEGCQQVLEKLGGYELVERGMVAVKGKGEMKTFWLVGETTARVPFNKLSENNASQLAVTSNHQLLKDLFPVNSSVFSSSQNCLKQGIRRNFLPELQRNAVAFESGSLTRRKQDFQDISPKKRSTSHEKDSSTFFLMSRKKSSASITTNDSLVNLTENNANLWVESLVNGAAAQHRRSIRVSSASGGTDQVSLNILGPSVHVKHERHRVNSLKPTVYDYSMKLNRDQKNRKVGNSLKDLVLQRMVTTNVTQVQPNSSKLRKISRSESVPFLKEGLKPAEDEAASQEMSC